MNTTKWNLLLTETYKMYKHYGKQVTLVDLMLRCDMPKDKALKLIDQSILHYKGSNNI